VVSRYAWPPDRTRFAGISGAGLPGIVHCSSTGRRSHIARADEQNVGYFLRHCDRRARVADTNRKAISFLDCKSHCPTGERHLNLVLNVLDRDAIPRRILSINIDLHVALTANRKPRSRFEHHESVLRTDSISLPNLIDHFQVRSEDLPRRCRSARPSRACRRDS